MNYTTDELLAKVKLWAALPTGQPAFSDAQLLDIMTDELRTVIAPFIVSFREDYYVASVDYDITADTNAYAIPSRAISNVLKDVNYKYSTREISVPRIPVGDKDYYTNGFYIKGNKIMLQNPSSRAGETLRVYYFIRPSSLVGTSECAKIETVDEDDGTYSVTGKPSSWSGSVNLDITQGDSPLGIIDIDNKTSISSLTFTPTTFPTDAISGDYACLAGESCVPQVPLELIPLLVQGTIVRVNEILNDPEGMKTADKKYQELKESATQILSPRVVEEPKVIMSRNSFMEERNTRWRLY